MIGAEGARVNCCYFHQFNHESDGRSSVCCGIFQEVISLWKTVVVIVSQYSNIQETTSENVSPTH